MAGDRKPSLIAIFADLLVGVGSTVVMAHVFPCSEVWQDWIPWEETPIQDHIKSINTETGAISPILCTPFREVSSDIPATEFLLPIMGLERIFGFRLKALATMIDVSDSVLSDWLTGHVLPVGEERKKTAVQLAQHFDGKPHAEFLKWLGTPLIGLGSRCPAQALVHGNSLPVLNYLALWSARDDHQSRRRA